MTKRKHVILFLLAIFIVVFVCLGATSEKSVSEKAKSELEKCTQCHSHRDSKAYKEWQKSNHAHSLENLLKDSDATNSCLKCHSADHSAMLVNHWLSPDNLPDIKSVKNTISCSSCHRHDSGIEHNLIMPADKLCVACHVHFCGG
jgi:predicted CXXCH cytochrome family protein